MNTLVSTEQLKNVTGYGRPGDIERCLRASGVPFLYGKDGKIFTTIDAINAAMGVQSQTPPTDQKFEFLD